MTDGLDPSELTREMLQEMRKLSMQVMMETLKNTHPKSGWNVLFKKTNNPDEKVNVREYLSYELARSEQERIIARINPSWTALVKDKRNR